MASTTVEILSNTEFVISLSNDSDQLNIAQYIDSNGTRAGDGTSYQIKTLVGWNGADSIASGSTATLIVSNIPTATIDSVIFNYPNNMFSISGSNLINIANPARDDITTTISIIGEGNSTQNSTAIYQINVTATVIDNTSFVISLNSVDSANVRNLLNRNGTKSNNNTIYKLAVNNGFNGVASLADEATITVIGISVATLTSVVYQYDNTNIASTLTINGNHFIHQADNDIDITQLVITGEI